MLALSQNRHSGIPFYSRAAVIYNPQAGNLKNARAERLSRLGEHLRETSGAVRFIATTGPRTAGALAKVAIEDGADLIIAAGGDGTISEVIEGLVKSDIPLGILPAGTANVLANEVGLPRDLLRAARQMAQCRPERVSLGQVRSNGGEIRHFLLMAGVGFDAEIIYHLSARWKDKLGKLSYFVGGLSRIGSELSEFEVVIDGEARTCTFALISRVRNYGGDFEIASQVRLQDNDFEIVLFEGRNSWRYLWYLAGVATKRLAHVPGVRFARSQAIELRPRQGGRVYLQADGELLGRLPAAIRIVPDAITLLLPPKPKPERREHAPDAGR